MRCIAPANCILVQSHFARLKNIFHACDMTQIKQGICVQLVKNSVV